jgi:hypothetical protein
VTTGLEPDPEPAMPQQQDAAWSEHDRRTRDVDRVRVLVERVGQSLQLDEEPVDARALAFVDRRPREERCSYHAAQAIGNFHTGA